MRPVELLKVGEEWGDPRLGDLLVVVHRVDAAGDRAQVRVTTFPGGGKAWAFHRSLKRGTSITLCRSRYENVGEVNETVERQALTCRVLSAMGNQVTLAGFELSDYEPAPPDGPAAAVAE